MKNITTEQKSMKNIEIMKNITAIEKTAIAKITANITAKITAKITTTALLFFLALFTLTTNLKAQAVQEDSKSGFFAGFVVLDGFQVDSNKSITTSPTTSYRVTRYDDETREIKADAAAIYDTTSGSRPIVLSPGIEALFKANCQTNANVVSVGGINYTFAVSVLNSFDAGTATGDSSPVTATGDNPYTITQSSTYQQFPSGFNTQNITGYQSYCYQYFYGGLAAERTPLFSEYEVTPDSGTPQVSAESDKLSGIGLQFGYRWEKWRASFTHYTGQGGDNEFTNSLVMADYFFGGEFFVGAGIASMQLTNSSAGSSTSASATSPVLQVGYTENLTSNLQLSIGVLQYSSGLSLSHSSTPATGNSLQETQTVEGDSAVIGVSIYSASSVINTLYYDSGDLRTVVTQVGERTVNIEEIVTPAGGGTVEAELKAPTVIGISLQYSF